MLHLFEAAVPVTAAIGSSSSSSISSSSPSSSLGAGELSGGGAAGTALALDAALEDVALGFDLEDFGVAAGDEGALDDAAKTDLACL